MVRPKRNADKNGAGPSEERGQGNHRRGSRHQEDFVEEPPLDAAQDFEHGAVGGMVGEPAVAEQYEHIPPDFREELAPFIRDMMREEIRGFLNVELAPAPGPAAAPNEEPGEFPLGRGAVPRRHRAANGEGTGHEAQLNQAPGGAGTATAPAHGPPAPNPPVKEDLSVKVKPFDPKEADWYAWRTQFVSIADQAGWTPRTRVLRLMGALQGNMAGVTAGLPSPVTYETLLARIDGIHGLENTREDAALRLQGLRMEPGADGGVALFAERVRQLCVRAYPNYTERDREEQALRVFLQGLPTRNDFRYQMRMRDFGTLRDAVEYGSRLEQIIRDERGDTRRGGAPARSAQQEAGPLTLDKLAKELQRWRELQTRQLDTQSRQLESLTRQLSTGGANRTEQGPRRTGPGPNERRTPQNTPCNNCGEIGHWYRDCPKRQGNGGHGGGAGGSDGRPGPSSN